MHSFFKRVLPAGGVEQVGARNAGRSDLKSKPIKIMKTTSKKIHVLLTAAAFGALATLAQAGPGVGYWKHVGKQSQFEQLKPGAKIAFVCNECRTVTEVPITSKEQAMAYCKEGATVTCPSCKMATKVVVKRERNGAPTHTEVTYVSDKGKECAFIAVKE